MLPQQLRDAVFAYWSPSKDIKWLMSYYIWQHHKITPDWIAATCFLSMMMDSPEEDRQFYSDMIDSAAVDCGWMHNKVLEGDSTFFRKFIMLHELQKKNGQTPKHDVLIMAEILKKLKNSTQIFVHMHCACLDNMSSSCKRCDYRCELLEKFGGQRRKHKLYDLHKMI